MYPDKLRNFIAHEKDDIYKTYWQFAKYHIPFCVLDDDDKFVGIVGKRDFENAIHSSERVLQTVSDITNYNCTTISDQNPYASARNIYAEKNIEYIPVIDSDRNVVDMFSRRRAFYKQYFFENKLYKMHYAANVWLAAKEAVKLGYTSISVIEFGVATGNGLLSLQFHAREIGNLMGIDIQVYGFDTGEGMPDTTEDYRNALYMYPSKIYKMDYQKLEPQLEKAKLVLGNIEETGKKFFEEYAPAPIGAIMIDVDWYTSAVAALNILQTNYENVMPRIYMYFDDILFGHTEHIGEGLAIHEFNQKNKGLINISPEQGHRYNTPISPVQDEHYPWQIPNGKICHFYQHPLYNKCVSSHLHIPLRNIDF